ncbi:MAG: hypothetical protein ACRC3F_18245, partial [Billgrantia desiderata]
MASRRYRWSEAKRLLTAGMMALLVTGCGNGEQGDAKLIEYQRALAEALGQPAPERTAPPNIGAFP